MTWLKMQNGSGGSGNIGNVSKWTGKKWILYGDSNTERNFWGKKYHDFVQERIGIDTVIRAWSSVGWMPKETPKNIHDRLDAWNDDGDVVTILLGGNDVGRIDGSDKRYEATPRELGQLGDKKEDETFYGWVDSTIEKLVEKYPLIPVACISQTRRSQELGKGDPALVAQMVQAEYEVCRKYGIPFLDTFHHGNVYPDNPTYRAECMEDGVHLTEKGSEFFSWKVQAFLETL